MELNLSLHDLHSTISDITYDSDSTASNSIIDEYISNKLDGTNRQQANNVNTIAISSSSNIQIGDRVVYNGPVTIRQEISSKGSVLKELKIKSVSEPPLEDIKIISKSHVRRNLFTVISLFLIMILILLILKLSLKFATNDITGENVSNTSKILLKFSNLSEVKLYSRSDWGAVEPNGPVDLLQLPLNKVIVCHTVRNNCYTKDCCLKAMKEMETQHMSIRYFRIGYNFVICNDGNIYEGIGWDKEGAHTRGQNLKSFGIAFNGDFSTELPNKNQVTAFFSLLKLGVELGKLTTDYKIFGARQFASTKSPGDALYQMVQTWDHWSEKI